MHYRILFLETGECPLVLNEQWSNGWNDWVETKPNSFPSIEAIRNVQRYKDKCTIGIVDLHGRNVDPPTVCEVAFYFLDLESAHKRAAKSYTDVNEELGDAMDDLWMNIVMAKMSPLMNSKTAFLDEKHRRLEEDRLNHKVPDWNPRELHRFQQYNPSGYRPIDPITPPIQIQFDPTLLKSTKS